VYPVQKGNWMKLEGIKAKLPKKNRTWVERAEKRLGFGAYCGWVIETCSIIWKEWKKKGEKLPRGDKIFGGRRSTSAWLCRVNKSTFSGAKFKVVR